MNDTSHEVAHPSRLLCLRSPAIECRRCDPIKQMRDCTARVPLTCDSTSPTGATKHSLDECRRFVFHDRALRPDRAPPPCHNNCSIRDNFFIQESRQFTGCVKNTIQRTKAVLCTEELLIGALRRRILASRVVAKDGPHVAYDDARAFLCRVTLISGCSTRPLRLLGEL